MIMGLDGRFTRIREYSEPGSGKVSDAQRKLKKYLLLTAFFIPLFLRACITLFYAEKDFHTGDALGVPTAIELFATTMLITLSMKKQKVFQNRSVIMFITGVSLWIWYQIIASVSGLHVYVSLSTYRGILSFAVSVATLFLLARIIIVYDWKLELIMLFCFVEGMTLLISYIVHFDNFAFLSNLGGIFKAQGRYRFSFGYVHVNTAGHKALFFLIMSFLYRKILKEKSEYALKSDKFNNFFLIPVSFVAVFIMLSSASRTSITGTVLFFMVYSFLKIRHKIGPYLTILLDIFIVMSIIIVVSIVDWEYILGESNRLGVFVSWDILMSTRAWVTGLGHIRGDELIRVFIIAAQTQAALDNYYIIIFIQSGLIGFIILIGTIFRFTISYFQGCLNMTDTQMAVGAMLVIYIYYGMFEGGLFGGNDTELMLVWALILVAMNERKPRKHIIYGHNRKHSGNMLKTL